jgi:hypothetical protein
MNIQRKHCKQGNGAQQIIGTTSDGEDYSTASQQKHFHPVNDVHHKIL